MQLRYISHTDFFYLVGSLVHLLKNESSFYECENQCAWVIAAYKNKKINKKLPEKLEVWSNLKGTVSYFLTENECCSHKYALIGV